MSLVDRLIRNASLSVLAGLTTSVGGFVAAAIVARSLGVTGTAAVAMALWLAFLTTTVADLGVTASLARFIPEEGRRGGPDGLAAFLWNRFRLLLLAIAGGLVLTGVILFFYWPDIVSKYADSPREAWGICGLIALCFVVHMLYAFAFQLLRGAADFRAISRYSLVGTVLQVVGVLVGTRWFGVTGALAGYVLASVPMLWALTRVRPARSDLPQPRRLEIRRYGLTYYVAALLSPLLWVKADLFLVDQFATARDVGLFAAAAVVAAMLIQLCQMVCNALLPSILHAWEDQPGSFARTSETTTRFALFLLLPVCTIGAALAPVAVGLVYGAEFEDAGPAAMLLGGAAAATAVTLVLSGVLNAAHANVPLARSGAVGAVLTVLLGMLFVSRFGLIGAALGRLAAQTVVAAMNIAAVNRVVPALVRWGWFSRYMLSSIAAGLAAAWVRDGNDIVDLLLGGIAGGVTFLMVTVVLLRLVEEDRRQLLRAAEGQSPNIRRLAALIAGRSA